ncbi:DNA replication/repair protein RecF [Salinibacterium sp. M195]|uniref:DNA replication/repair protein RecF n=1 Tax=Salinibacterium sp. M195 TaxID=2583374 RepID=UPI001C62C323|nr:DNA replication/repair protein RecF [Salinibacterium sp. M195]QYH34874.1 DNA replication/repair protein RecF [Salinibacterium sp. M195]
MLVTHVELKDFRNYESLALELGAGPTLIVGSNGQGKTNLVEALGFLSTLGSHRVSTDHAMVRQHTDAAIVRVRLEHNDRKFLAEVQINRSGANRAQINRSAIRTRELPRYFSSVLFAPEDLVLVRGEPSGRRRFIDDLLILRSPRFSGVISDYERVVKQRNMLLKTARASGNRDAQLSTLDVWDERLIEFGSEIISARSSLVADLSPEVSRAYERIVGADHGASLANSLSIVSRQDDPENAVATNAVGEIISVADATTAFAAALDSVRKTERDRAITLVGPHRDDLIFGLNGLPARGYASHGESWSFALALKLASAELLRRESSAGDPVLILDDVFAELDQSRRERLAESIANFEQVLITAAVFDDVPEHLAAHVIHIRAGEVVGSE